jgi:hypothetical protein
MKFERFIYDMLKHQILIFVFITSCAQTFAQLSLVSNQDIDFSNVVSTVSSGDWSNPNIWSSGSVPTAADNVSIENHTVYIDLMGTSSGEIVDLCNNLRVQSGGVLRMGHDLSNFAKDLRINGSILCLGTFSAGREQPSGSGDGSLYNHNSRIYLNLNQDTTYISGSGFFNPKSLIISSSDDNKALIIDHYNVVIDDSFVLKSDFRINATIEYYSYVNIKQNLGLTGSTFQWSSPTAKADLTIKGIVLAENVSLFTKNPNQGEFSSLTISNKGSLYVKSINEGELGVTSAAAGFNLNINNGGLLRLGEGVEFDNLTQNNPNFSLSNNGDIREHYSETLPTKNQITAAINNHDPNLGADACDIVDIFGSSHIAGWYNFTDTPYLLEGLDFYEDFGATSIKTTLTATNGKMFSAYPFNHNWPNFQTLTQIAQHQFIDSLFSRSHIKTHTFWTTSKNKGDWKQGPDFDHQSYLNEEQQFYDLTVHLLTTYGQMDKKFVYQNWEGDWMLRDQGVLWEQNPSLIPDDVNWDIEGMARMFRVRQRGTERARNEFPSSVAKVFHGIEFNKLWWNDNGTRKTMMDSNIPCVVADVVPKARIDLSSWSAYDGSWTNSANPHGHAMWRGLEMARYLTTESQDFPTAFPVQIGEFAINENPPYNGNNNQALINERYGRYVGLTLALGIPNFYLWNLYCSGQQGGPNGFTWQKGVQYDTDFLYDWMDGKWLIEPDGSWGHAANFLMEQWACNLSTPSTLAENNIRIFPNPSAHYFSISGVQGPISVSMYDIQGRLVKSIKNTLNYSIDTSNLEKGSYILCLKTSSYEITNKKIIIN